MELLKILEYTGYVLFGAFVLYFSHKNLIYIVGIDRPENVNKVNLELLHSTNIITDQGFRIEGKSSQILFFNCIDKKDPKYILYNLLCKTENENYFIIKCKYRMAFNFEHKEVEPLSKQEAIKWLAANTTSEGFEQVFGLVPAY